MDSKLVNFMADLMEKEAIALVKEKIAQGVDPDRILDDARSAMEVVGKRFEACEYFIPDLMMAGEILRQVSEIVKPLMAKETGGKKLGKVIMGTVAGDIHDIGKNMVTFMLDVSGFNVLDLGIDIPANVFVEKIKEFQPQVVGLSGFLTLAFDSMKKTVEAIERAGLRDKVKIIIGGGQVDEAVRKYVKADAYGKDAVAGVQLAKKWITGQQ
jgi:5-methyltetrahydrofolate--homocysteine methyltransferase